MAFTAKIENIIAADETGLLAQHATWKRVGLTEIAEILNGAPFDSALFSNDHGVPLARIRDVLAGVTKTYYTGKFDEAFALRQGDLLVGMDGDFHVGFWGTQRALLNQRATTSRPKAASNCCTASSSSAARAGKRGNARRPSSRARRCRRVGRTSTPSRSRLTRASCRRCRRDGFGRV